jgi:hypothetical protein
LIFILGALPRRPGVAAGLAALCLLAMGVLAGCNTNYNLGATGSVGIGNNVAITTAGNITQLYQGGSITVTATTANDPTNAGVTFTLSQGAKGYICPQSVSVADCTSQASQAPVKCPGATCTIVYVAQPTSVAPIQGAGTAQITATSNANSIYTAEVTLVTFGTPVMNAGGSLANPGALFPGFVSIAYQTQISVAGGTSPFTWALASGSTLPAGLTLNGSTTASTTITGTPTTAGSYTFTVQATDSNKIVASEQLHLIIGAKSACILNGTYTFTFSGFRGGSAATHIGNIRVNSDGTITGEQDYKDGHRTTVHETLTSQSNCQNISTNTGFLRLYAPSGQLDYTFAAVPPDAAGVIHAARLQLVSSGADSGSGQMMLTDAAALTGAPPSGNFAFGVLGVDGNSGHYGTVGRFTSDASGHLSAGQVDSNGTNSSAFGADVNNAALTGALSAADALGRGTATLTAGGVTSTLVYYIVDANRLFLMNVTPTVNTPRESGFLTTQVGDVVATNSFDNSAFDSPSILSLWGNVGKVNPSTIVAMGRLSNANPAAGTVDATLDVANQAADTANLAYSAQTYAVTASGRGTLALTDSGGTSSFVFYLDGTASGYILQTGSAAGNSGLLEAQAPPPAGGYTPNLVGTFVGGTQYPQAAGPISLLSLVYVNYGQLSSAYTNGTFSVDPNTGRGFAQITFTGIGLLQDVMYIVSPTKVNLMNYGTTTGINGTILWLIQ